MIPSLHVVTDDAVLEREEFPVRAREIAEEGGAGLALHVRGPGQSGRRIHDLCHVLRDPVRRAGALLLVNDRVDVALALDLDGVHLAARSLPPEEARRLVGERTLGRSVHDLGEAEEMDRRGVDFLLLGTIFPTSSHPGRGGGGVGSVRAVSSRTERPVIAIGGIDGTRVADVLRAGAHGVAVRSAVWDAPDAARAVRELLRRLESER